MKLSQYPRLCILLIVLLFVSGCASKSDDSTVSPSSPSENPGGETTTEILYAGSGKADVTAKMIMSTGGKAVRFMGGTLDLSAQEVKSVVDAALEYSSAASALCRIRNTRLVSTAGGGAGKAVVVTAGSGNLRLVACALVGQAPATVSIDAVAATNVVLYGECTANLAKGANLTLVGSALTVNSSLT